MQVAGNADAAKQADVVAALLQYHVLDARVESTDFTETAAFVPTLLTNETYTTVEGGQVVGGIAKDGGVSIFSGLKKESKVSTADVKFDGGVVHVIDTVLTIPGSIADAAAANNLTSLVEALTAAKLVDTVLSLDTATVFAPTNKAFEKIADVAANLTTEKLASVLTYHVVNGTAAYSSGLKNGDVPTVNGQSVTIEVNDGAVKVNDAKVVVADVLVSNGVVHVIDSVLLPKADDEVTPSGTAAPSGTVPTSGTGSAPTSAFTGAATRPTGVMAAGVLGAAAVMAMAM